MCPNLNSLMKFAELRVVQSHTEPTIAWERIATRATSRAAHADNALLEAFDSGDHYFEHFRRVTIAAPAIDVDTTAGYDPTIEHVVAFVTTP